MKTIEEMLQNLARANVSEFALVSERLPCIKVGGQFKPVDDYAPNTDEILQMLVQAGGTWYVAALGPAPTQWTFSIEGIGTIGIQVVMRDRLVQARFMVVQRDPFATAGHQGPVVQAPAPAMQRPPPPTGPGGSPAAQRPPPPTGPGSRVGAPAASSARGAPPMRQNPPFPPPPPSSAVALIANEPFFDDEPRTNAAPTTRGRPQAQPARAPFPPPPALVPREPGTESGAPDAGGFDFDAPVGQLPPPAAPEPATASWKKATQMSSPGAARPMHPTRPELPRPDLLMPEPPAPPDTGIDARAAMDALVLRLAEELDVGPRRVRVVIELVLETIDQTGLPARDALEALAAAEKGTKKK